MKNKDARIDRKTVKKRKTIGEDQPCQLLMYAVSLFCQLCATGTLMGTQVSGIEQEVQKETTVNMEI